MCAIHRRFCFFLISFVGILALFSGTVACLPLWAAGVDPETSSPRPVPMPSLIGVGLGDGTDALRALGIDNVSTVPSDGHLFVLNQDNWIVVRQAPRAGNTVEPSQEVTLSVEKTDEAESRFCFDGDC